MSQTSARSKRLTKRNILKAFQEEKYQLSRRIFLAEKSLLGEEPASMSQKIQTLKSDFDDMLFKQYELLKSFVASETESLEQKNQLIRDIEASQDNILLRRESHFEKYNDLHTEYCHIWFLGTGRWACLLPASAHEGYIDQNLEKCGYINKFFDS
jgi:hypothetical protein